VDYGLQIADYGFTSWLPSAVQITGCRLQIPDFGLQIHFVAAFGGGDCELRIADCGFTSWLTSSVQITGCRLQIPDCGLQIHFEAAIGGADYTIKSNCIHSVFEGLSVTITEYCKKLA